MDTENNPRIIGAFDKATELRQLAEDPLKDGMLRIYTDHTGRYYRDVDENDNPFDLSQSVIGRIFLEEVRKEADLEIIGRIKELGLI